MSAPFHIPYCGAPPSAATLFTRWNIDPRLIAALIAGAAIYVLTTRVRRTRGLASDSSRQGFFWIGWAVLALALMSPLCALSVSLFAARVGQHMVLTLIAAPLIAMGLPILRLRVAHREIAAAALFAAALWIWHAPGPYAATFASDWTYWAMHVTMIGAATLFWWLVLRAPSQRMALAAAATVATGLQMSLLGAVITWAGRPLYTPHLFTTQAWGLTPLQDQALGGALMWIPGGVIFIAALVTPLAILLGNRPAPSAQSA